MIDLARAPGEPASAWVQSRCHANPEQSAPQHSDPAAGAHCLRNVRPGLDSDTVQQHTPKPGPRNKATLKELRPASKPASSHSESDRPVYQSTSLPKATPEESKHGSACPQCTQTLSVQEVPCSDKASTCNSCHRNFFAHMM